MQPTTRNAASLRRACLAVFFVAATSAAPVGAAGGGSIEDDLARYGRYDQNLYYLTATTLSRGIDGMGQCFEARKRELVDRVAERVVAAPRPADAEEDVARCLAAADGKPWTDELAEDLSIALLERGYESERLRARASRSFRGDRLLAERELAARTLKASGSLLEHLYFEEGDHARVVDELGTKASGSFVGQNLKFFDKGELAFTFDDGPHTGGRTDRVLDALQANGFKATFFQLGSSFSSSPAFTAVAARIRDEGHDVGVHGWFHATKDGKPFTALSPAAIKVDLRKTHELITGAYGRAPVTFRAPYGEFRATDFPILKELGLTYVGWDIDTNDWKKVTPAELAAETIKLIQQRGRGIVLMHDIQQRSSEAIETILAFVKKNGYRAVTVRQKLEAARASRTCPSR